ncbi:hypothetical protein J2X46_003194 [Nocardioides sp. BE266]|nr:hypothetical protein [Nocardioides sp. BE266]
MSGSLVTTKTDRALRDLSAVAIVWSARSTATRAAT